MTRPGIQPLIYFWRGADRPSWNLVDVAKTLKLPSFFTELFLVLRRIATRGITVSDVYIYTHFISADVRRSAETFYRFAASRAERLGDSMMRARTCAPRIICGIRHSQILSTSPDQMPHSPVASNAGRLSVPAHRLRLQSLSPIDLSCRES